MALEIDYLVPIDILSDDFGSFLAKGQFFGCFHLGLECRRNFTFADLQVGVRAAGRPILGAFVPVLFSHERDGYYWTQVKIGGTPEAPTENLGARLAAAIALAPAAGAAQSAVEIPAAASEAVGGLLRGIMGR